MKKTPFKRKPPKPKQKKTKTLPSPSVLKKRLDAVYSLYIRNKYSVEGLVHCFTCSAILPIAKIQNGHYISRSHNSLRFDDRNCHPQCVACNIFKHGNMAEYAMRLIDKYGPDILNELDRERRKIKQFSRPELISLIEKYNGAMGH